MKRISKAIAVLSSALAVLSFSVPMANAASLPSAGQIKVIQCSGNECTDLQSFLQNACSSGSCNPNDIQSVLQNACSSGSCNLNDILKNINNCISCGPAGCEKTDVPSQQPSVPSSTPSVPSSTPSVPSSTPSDESPVQPTVPVQNDNSEFNTAYEAEVLRLVNIERAKYGLSALSYDSGAAKAAHIRAKEIVISFSHTRPDGSSCFTAAQETGFTYRTAGENIAYGYATPEQVVTGWMNSEGHRKNILSSSFTKLGVGCYKSGNTLYWSQFFIG